MLLAQAGKLFYDCAKGEHRDLKIAIVGLFQTAISSEDLFIAGLTLMLNECHIVEILVSALSSSLKD